MIVASFYICLIVHILVFVGVISKLYNSSYVLRILVVAYPYGLASVLILDDYRGSSLSVVAQVGPCPYGHDPLTDDIDRSILDASLTCVQQDIASLLKHPC